MRDLFGMKIATATITAMARRTAGRFENLLEHPPQVLRSDPVPVKHLAETAVRVGSDQRWLHVLCPRLLSALRIASGPGDVGQDLEGILIHDAFASYFSLGGSFGRLLESS